METDAAVGEVFNIGSTEEVSMLELAERVKQACGSDSEIRLVPYEEAYESGLRGHAPAHPGHDQDRGAARLAARLIRWTRYSRT